MFGRMMMVAAVVLGLNACGGNDDPLAAKCGAACDPSAVMVCASMDASACVKDCQARIAGLSATCATCITEGNAWKLACDDRRAGAANTCQGYEFPSITDPSSGGCKSSCQ